MNENESNEGNGLDTSVSVNKTMSSNDWTQQLCDESVLQMLEEPFDIDLDGSRLRTDDKYYGFNNNTGDTWIYPTNLPVRRYQFNITQVSLFRNTLVVLPTGLGKTFIAAVVMYNIYRWYPRGKIIFMAPTRPLVAQQVEACRKIMGIPSKDTAEMTGRLNKKTRHENWQTKRVFFVTPQIVQSDLKESEFPFADIKLIVVDEAHKAKGRYAYTEVLQAINARNPNFRVLALSATPGHRIEDVIEVVQNLFISHIEVRWENSIDVAPYTFKRNIKTIVVNFTEELRQTRNDFISIMDPYVRFLIDNGVLSGSIKNISSGWIVMEHKRFREMSISNRHPKHAEVSTNFSICVSLAHALDVLERHGLRVFLNFFDDESNSTGEKFFISMDMKLKSFLKDLRNKVGPNPFQISDQTMTNGQIQKMPDNLDFGHPKFDLVKQHVLDHFKKNKDSKVIIFCEYRESVLLMHRLLLQCRPLVLPRVFVGQGGTGAIRAVTQKQQIKIMSDFRSGISNTLIATSVAEEGIDVGEVDLIICFDISTRNPTRFVQRIGRTGRRRQGNIIMMATEGKEQALVKEVLATKDKTNHKIVKSKEILKSLYTKSPRIVPPEFDPKCVESIMKVDENNDDNDADGDGEKQLKTKKTKKTDKENVKATKRKNVKTSSQSQAGKSDVRNFFQKINLDKEERDIFSIPKKPSPSKTVKAVHNVIDNEIHIEEANIDDDNPDKKAASILKRIKNFSKSIQEPFEMKSANIMKFLESKDYTNESKKFFLERNFDYVKEKYEAFKVIELIQKDNDSGIIEKDAENVLQEYLLIEKLFEGTDKVEEFLRNKKTDMYSEYKKKFSSIFEGLEERSFFDSVEPFINEQLKNINLSNPDQIEDVDMEKQSISVVDENDLSHVNQTNSYLLENDEDISLIENNDSKYLSQWNQFAPKKIQKQSTPLRKTVVVSIKNRSIHESPLAKAFAKSASKINSSIISNNNTIESPRSKNSFETNKNSTIKNSSAFFDDDFDNILVDSTKLLIQDKNLPIKNNSIVKSFTEGNDSYISVENILKLVEEQEKKLELEKSFKNDIEKKSNQEIEDFDVNEFLEEFDCNDFNEFNKPTKNIQDKKEDCDRGNNNIQADVVSPLTIDAIQVLVNNVQLNNNTNSPKKFIDIKTADTSPSVISKRVNLKKLKLSGSSSGSINSKSLEKLQCIPTTSHNSMIIAENIIKSQHFPSISSSQSRIQQDEAMNETVIAGIKKTNRLIESSNSEDDIKGSPEKMKLRKNIKSRTNKRKRCVFIDDEAKDSDGNSGDDDLNDDLSKFVVDSIVVSDVDDDIEENSCIDMKAKYLQSIRSPVKALGRFKIPEKRQYMDLSNIFSQAVPFESNSVYKENSFVISDSDDENCEIKSSQICPLERAEAILKAHRKAKRNGLNFENPLKEEIPAKRRRILNRVEESSEESE